MLQNTMRFQWFQTQLLQTQCVSMVSNEIASAHNVFQQFKMKYNENTTLSMSSDEIT